MAALDEDGEILDELAKHVAKHLNKTPA